MLSVAVGIRTVVSVLYGIMGDMPSFLSRQNDMESPISLNFTCLKLPTDPLCQCFLKVRVLILIDRGNVHFE